MKINNDVEIVGYVLPNAASDDYGWTQNEGAGRLWGKPVVFLAAFDAANKQIEELTNIAALYQKNMWELKDALDEATGVIK